jgi:hypothetical protein
MSIRPSIIFSTIKPSLSGGYQNIGLVDPVVPPSNVSNLGLPITPAPSQGPGGETWKEFSINLSLGDVISPADLNNFNQLLKNINSVAQGLVAIIKIIRLLTSDLLSLNRAFKFVIQLIVTQLKSLIQTFLSTGIYVSVIQPRQSPHEKGYFFPTWADFNEFKTVLVSACTNPGNIGSPAQLGPNATVGGFIIGATAGSNDLGVIDQVIENFKIIGNLFGFKTPFPGPPKNAKAVGGLFDTKLGIQLTWDKPDSFIFGGFRVYRCMNKEGTFPSSSDMDLIIANTPTASNPNQLRDFQTIKMFDNDASGGTPFNSGKPLFVPVSLTSESYSIIDYDVVQGTTYYYRIFTVIENSGLANDPYMFRLGSPMSSNEASATAAGCIPVSEIPTGILTTGGSWVNEKDLMLEWTYVNLNRFFGSQVDQLLKVIDNFADKLIGFVSTGSDAIDEFLDFFSGKINDYINIVQTITNVVNILMNFRMQGSLLFLDLTNTQPGGITNFADRIAHAGVQSSTFGTIPPSASTVLANSGITNTNAGPLTKQMSDSIGQSLDALKGIYVGVMVVFGTVDPTDKQTLNTITAPYLEEYNDVQQQLSGTQDSINMLVKILLGKGT